MSVDDLKEGLKAVVKPLFFPIKSIIRVSSQHPFITLFFLLLGGAACWASINFLFPLNLAISLGVMCFFSIWSLVPLATKILTPRCKYSESMWVALDYAMLAGFILPLSTALVFAWFFCSVFWSLIITLLIFMALSLVILSLGVAMLPGQPGNDADRKKDNVFDYFYMIEEYLAPVDRPFWEERACLHPGGTLALIAEIAESYFTGKLPNELKSVGSPRTPDYKKAFFWYQRLESASELGSKHAQYWRNSPDTWRALSQLKLGVFYMEGYGGVPKDLQKAAVLFEKVIVVSASYSNSATFAEYKQYARAGLEKLGKEQTKESKVAFLMAMKRAPKEPIQAGFPDFPKLPTPESSQEEKIASSNLMKPYCPPIPVKPAGQPVNRDLYDLSPFRLIFEMAGLSESVIKDTQESCEKYERLISGLSRG